MFAIETSDIYQLFQHVLYRAFPIQKQYSLDDCFALLADLERKSSRCFLVIGSVKYHPKSKSTVSVTGLQSTTLLRIKTPSRGLHCVKNAEIPAFSDLYFPIYGPNHIRIFPEKKYGYDSVHILENTDQRKPVFRHNLRTVFLCRNFIIV